MFPDMYAVIRTSSTPGKFFLSAAVVIGSLYPILLESDEKLTGVSFVLSAIAAVVALIGSAVCAVVVDVATLVALEERVAIGKKKVLAWSVAVNNKITP